MRLVAGTGVRTSNASGAQLTFFDGSTLTLDPNTNIEIVQIDSDGRQADTILLKQWIGRTWSRVAKMLDPGSRYEIQTPTALAVVRGTLFSTEVDDAQRTRVQTSEGLVSVLAQSKEVYVPAGQETTVEPGLPPSEPAKVSLSRDQGRSGNQGQGSGSQGQGGGNQGQAGGNQGQGSGNQGQGGGNSGQGSGNQGQGSGNSGQGSGNSGQGSGNTGQGSGNQGQAVGNQGQAVGNQGQA
ncbi:MAG: FecR domain-containing protein, partial [Chloroflexi bacterium]|nr:FecR domain-containing protein [Chloroflexota bacterium]